jgi:hypothetical protein
LPLYHVHFLKNSLNGSTQQTDTIVCDNPIEFESDIEDIEHDLASSHREGEFTTVSLISWRELKGGKRPTPIKETNW